ncbi:MAG: Clp protease N-terminal domain-containing protein [Fimbriimonadales bacterium]
MWQRFTERARKVVFHAQEEAQRFGEGYVSTEHLLLGLVRESEDTAAGVLKGMGISLNRIRKEVENQLPRGDARPSQDMTLTPRAKRVIDLSYEEARNFGDNYIGTEHLLLGLIREGDGLAGRVLAKLGADLDHARAVLIAQRVGDDKDGHTGGAEPVLPSPKQFPLTPQARAIAFLSGGRIHEHLLLTMIANPESNAAKIIAAQCEDIGAFQLALWQEMARAAAIGYHRTNGGIIDELLASAQTEAGGEPIQPHHILLALLRIQDPAFSRTLQDHGLSYERSRELAGEL